MPQDEEQDREQDAVSQGPGEPGQQMQEDDMGNIYGDDDDYLDDPRLRRRADVDAVDDALEPGEGPREEEAQRDEAVMHDGYGEGPVEREDVGAERTDIPAPNAEYRNTVRSAPHAGGRR